MPPYFSKETIYIDFTIIAVNKLFFCIFTDQICRYMLLFSLLLTYFTEKCMNFNICYLAVGWFVLVVNLLFIGAQESARG